VSQKVDRFIFTITSAKVDQFSYIFTLKFRKDLGKTGIKNIIYLPSYLLPHYLAKSKCSTMQLYGCCTEVIVKIKMVYVFETLGYA